MSINHLVVVDLVERGSQVDTLPDLPPAAVLKVLPSALLNRAPLHLGVGDKVPEVDALRVEILDLQVEQLQPGHRRLDAVLSAFLIRAEDINSSRAIIAPVLSIKANAFDGVVVVGDLEDTVLGVATPDAGFGVAGDGDTFIFFAMGDREAVVLVVSLFEVARVSGLYDVKADGFEVFSRFDGDRSSRGGGEELRKKERGWMGSAEIWN